MVEYAMIVGWVVLVILILLTSLGGNIKGFFSQTANSLQSVAS